MPAEHSLWAIKADTDAVLKEISVELGALYSSTGRPSIPPERLLKGQLLIALYSVRSDRQFCQMLDYNILFPDMSLDEPGLDQSAFSRLREIMGATSEEGSGFPSAPMRRRGYHAYVNYDATYKSGVGAENKLNDASPPIEGKNSIGLYVKKNDAVGFWSEGGAFSNVANEIPGFNAVAGMHDMMMTSFRGTWGTIFNVPLMPLAAAKVSAVIGAQPGWTHYYVVATERRRDGG